MAENLAVAVDLGATRFRACVGTRRGKIIRRESRRMVITKSVEDYLAQIADAMKHITRGIEHSELMAMCVATPGPLDLKRGRIVRTANLPYSEVPIMGALRETFHKEAYLVNDANAAALGEWLHGAGRGHQNVFYLTISTGIGGGAVVDGRLLIGKEGNAAEVGHITIDCSGRMICGCGRPGHWEAYCSGSGIPGYARRLLEDLDSAERKTVSGSSIARNAKALDTPRIFRAAAHGDKFALRVLAEVGRLNAMGVANVTDAFDPEIVSIGGAVALNNPEAILTPIRIHVAEYAINGVPEVRITPLGDDAGLLGALSVAHDPHLIGR